jgi:regulator of protease activity HflC (stomatin/prohibitin superfamily)
MEILFWAIVGFLGLCILLGLFTVKQSTKYVIERFGKFKAIANPGLNLKVPFIDRISGKLNMRVRQLDVQVETKTKDDVFVRVLVSVQYFVIPGKEYQAFYLLDDASEQIRSFIFDVVRAQVPTIILDDVFEKKDDIANVVKKELATVMEQFGWGIVKALVTDIDPDAKVKIAMNDINAAQRMRIAATEKGEADRILKVKAAQAEAESKALQGRGIADQRKAIVEGLRDSVEDFRSGVPGATATDVMNLVLMTQYFDTLKDIGASNKSSTILIPHSPGNLKNIADQIESSMITANEVNGRRKAAG